MRLALEGVERLALCDAVAVAQRATGTDVRKAARRVKGISVVRRREKITADE